MTSSAKLQREADAARVGLADTLGQLRHGMAPSALSGEALALAKDTGLSLVRSLSDLTSERPVSLASASASPDSADGAMPLRSWPSVSASPTRAASASR